MDVLKIDEKGQLEVLLESVEIRLLIWKIFNIHEISAQQNKINYSIRFDKGVPKYLITDQSKFA